LAVPKVIKEQIDNNHIILATLASFFCFIFIIAVVTSVVIDPYIKAASFEENLLNFYEENNESHKIYIVGDSLPQWGIDSLILEKYLQNKINFTVQGFYKVEDWSGTPTRWMQADSSLEASSPENCTAILSLSAMSFYSSRVLEIYNNDNLLVRSAVPSSGYVKVTTPVRLSKGTNTIRLHVLEGCEKPRNIRELNNSDYRCLSMAVQNITLNERESNEVYNLAFPGDFSTSRIAELFYMAKSKPKIVVFCLQYYWFSDIIYPDNPDVRPRYTYLENRFALSANRLMLDSLTKSFFNKKELDIIQMDFLHLIAYKRMLLMPSLQLKLSKVPRLSGTLYIKPFLEPKTPLLFGLASTPNFKVDFIPPKVTLNQTTSERTKINNTPNNQEKAFLHMINVLKEQGTNVMIITMPYRSSLLQSFSNESKSNYLNFINKTKSHHYDLISYCSDMEFYNENHLNSYGRQNLSIKVGEILRSEVKNASK
jgi:hypothetical protein